MEALPTHDLERSVTFLYLVKHVKVASVVVLLYDYFLTLEPEVKFIWKAKWGIGKVLFLLARYPAIISAPLVLYYLFAPNLSPKSCHDLYSAGTWLLTTEIGWAEAILIMRTTALSGNNWRVLVFLFGVQFAVFCPGIWVVSKFLDSVEYGDPPYDSIIGCYTIRHSPIVRYGFTAVLVEELIIMLLTLWFGLTRFRHSNNHIVATLYRDGILYFVYLALVSLANILVLFLGPPDLLDLLVTFQPVMHSVLSCRIVLHVRSAASKDQLTHRSGPVSAIEFNPPETQRPEGSFWQRTAQSIMSPQTWTIEDPHAGYELTAISEHSSR